MHLTCLFPKAPFKFPSYKQLGQESSQFFLTLIIKDSAFVQRAHCTHQGSFITFIPPDSLGVPFLSSCISGNPYKWEHQVFSILPEHQELSISLTSASPVQSLLTLGNLCGKPQSGALHAINLSNLLLPLNTLTWPSASKPHIFTRFNINPLSILLLSWGKRMNTAILTQKLPTKLFQKLQVFLHCHAAYNLEGKKRQMLSL